MSTTGQQMNSAQFTQFILESVAGTYNAAGARYLLKGLKGEFVPEESWANFRPDGFNEDLWNALSKSHRLFQGTIQWDFEDLPVLLQMLAGAGADTTPEDEEDYVEATHAMPPHGPRDLVTFTIERGERDNCERCPYGLLLTINLEADRDGERVSGDFTILCQAPIATGVSMTGATQTGKVWRFHSDDPAGNYQLNGMVAKALTDNLATWQAALRATGGDFANATLAGTIQASSATIFGTDGNGGEATDVRNAFDGNVNTAAGNMRFANATIGVVYAANQTVSEARIHADVNPAITWTFETSEDTTDGEDGAWDEQGTVGAGSGTRNIVPGAPITAKGFRWRRVEGGGTNAAPESVEFVGAAASIPLLDFTVSLPYAAGDADTPEVVGNGAEIDLQTAWSNGTIVIPKRVPLMPQMWSIRQADTRAGLAGANPIDKAKVVRFGFDNLVEPVWFGEENVLTYRSHVDADPTRTLGFRLAKASTYTAGTLSDAAEQPAKERWREIRFVHPNTVHRFAIQLLAAPSGPAPIQAAGNVRAYEFPLGVVLDNEALGYAGPESDGASIYMIARTAPA